MLAYILSGFLVGILVLIFLPKTNNAIYKNQNEQNSFEFQQKNEATKAALKKANDEKEKFIEDSFLNLLANKSGQKEAEIFKNLIVSLKNTKNLEQKIFIFKSTLVLAIFYFFMVLLTRDPNPVFCFKKIWTEIDQLSQNMKWFN